MGRIMAAPAARATSASRATAASALAAVTKPAVEVKVESNEVTAARERKPAANMEKGVANMGAHAEKTSRYKGAGENAGAAGAVRGKSKEVVELRRDTGRAGARTSILTEAQATEVFKLRPAIRTDRAALCAELAERYRITTTAIRHIWDRRTWIWTNMPHWTQDEMAASLAEGVCDVCRLNKIEKVEDTCENCPLNRKRGRPRGARDTYRRQRKALGVDSPTNLDEAGAASAGPVPANV